jgi:Tol biopolymer transport system component
MKQFVLTTAAAAGLALATPAAAQVTAVNGKIAYMVCGFFNGDLVCDIWSINPDGTGNTNLTNTPEVNEAQPAWSADGTRIAYIEGSSGGNVLKIMNADGTNQVTVTPTLSFQFGPTWSPDGTRIALTRQVPGSAISEQFDIVVVNTNGSGEANITNSDFDEIEPAWSPDGATIAFAGVRFEQIVNPSTGDTSTAAQWEIVTVNPDGSGEQIVSAGDPGSVRAQSLEEDRAPAWAPDSSALVFMSQSVDPCCTPWQLWRVNRNGTGAVVLSDNPDVNDLWPSYSPDGTLIVFSSTRDSTSGDTDLYTMPASGLAPAGAGAGALAVTTEAAAPTGSVTRLTTSGGARDPAWGRQPGAPPQALTLRIRLDLRGRNAGGLVTSFPAGIFCGSDCSEVYERGTVVVLSAVPSLGSRFVGWTGACKGPQVQCIVTMDNMKAATARFVGAR